MAASTLVLVDAGMVAGFRRANLSLAQLHQALVHLYHQHPEAMVAVVADPSVKWDLSGPEQAAFEGDVVAQVVVCAPAGALDGTIGFLERAAKRGLDAGHHVVAFTDRALAEVPLGRLRNEGGCWIWDLDSSITLDTAGAASAKSADSTRRRRRSR